jgi:DNA-binding transcriptional MerR regulator/methylmalonyl-CoA mutase cobalamin-binding subunit
VSQQSYPLKTVSRLTGLSPDVIRAWERRYAVVSPMRGPRGARLYSGEDVARLRLLGNLVTNGRSIGDVASLEPDALRSLAAEHAPAEPTAGTDGARRIGEVLDALRTFDAMAVERLLGESLFALGARRFVAQVGAPLLERIGELWEAGELSVAEEHIASTTIRSLFGALVRMQMPSRAPTVLLTAPSGERHELGLSMVTLLCLQGGLGVACAGTDLPAEEVVTAARRSGVSVVGLSLISSANRAHAVDQIGRIESQLPGDVEIWLGGRDAAEVAAQMPGSRALVLQTTSAIEREIGRVALREQATASGRAS